MGFWSLGWAVGVFFEVFFVRNNFVPIEQVSVHPLLLLTGHNQDDYKTTHPKKQLQFPERQCHQV
jgi:hypothetical protein